jgi:hypothetical protein
MKSKFILSIFLTCVVWSAFSGTDETAAKKKVTHHIQFLFGNYISILRNVGDKGVYSPTSMYYYSMGFEYKAEFTRMFALRTGINYFTYGSGGQTVMANEAVPTAYVFTSYVHVPVDLVVHKDLRRGRLVFTAGPDIYLPTNSFAKYGTRPMTHNHYALADFFEEGSLGFTAGLGFEKKFSNKLSVEFMPDFRVLNIVPFNILRTVPRWESRWPDTIKMAFGLSTYITFY